MEGLPIQTRSGAWLAAFEIRVGLMARILRRDDVPTDGTVHRRKR